MLAARYRASRPTAGTVEVPTLVWRAVLTLALAVAAVVLLTRAWDLVALLGTPLGG